MPLEGPAHPGSAGRGAAIPALDHGRTLEEVTVVMRRRANVDPGRAWVICLWAARAHRGGLAERPATRGCCRWPAGGVRRGRAPPARLRTDRGG